jgi:hypothetical protein
MEVSSQLVNTPALVAADNATSAPACGAQIRCPRIFLRNLSNEGDVIHEMDAAMLAGADCDLISRVGGARRQTRSGAAADAERWILEGFASLSARR